MCSKGELLLRWKYLHCATQSNILHLSAKYETPPQYPQLVLSPRVC